MAEVIVHKDSIYYFIDSLSVIPTSLRFFTDPSIKEEDFKTVNNGIQIINDELRSQWHQDTLKFEYRVLPVNLEKTYSNLNTSLLQSKDQAIYIGYDYRPEKSSNPLIQEQGIDYDGSFARGFSLGNNQRLVTMN